MRHRQPPRSADTISPARLPALLLAGLLVLSACATAPPPPPATGAKSSAYKEGVPGGVIVNTVELSARITAIDRVNRRVTLLDAEGNKQTVKVGPKAINFDQVKVGDLVKLTLTEELVIYLDAEGAAVPDGSAGVALLPKRGGQPGGLVAETQQVTATVVGIDPARRTATLKFEDGSLKTFPVRDDIDLSRRKLGEKVVFLATEMIAIMVEKP